MGVYARAELYDDYGVTWKIDLHDNTYAGSVNEVKLSAPGFELGRDNGKSLLFTPIASSNLNVYYEVNDGDAIDSLITDLVNGVENQFYILLYKNNVLHWMGNVLTDGITFPDETPYTFTITATDGLKRLDDIPFTFAQTATADQNTFGKYIYEALKLTGFESFFGNSDTYIQSCISWKADEQRSNYDPLVDQRISRYRFYEDIEEDEPVSCLEAISICLRCLGASIRFDSGKWFICQFGNFVYDSITTYSYTKTTTWGTTTPTVSTYDPRFTPASGAETYVLTHSYLPMVRKCRVMWSIESGYTFSKPRIPAGQAVPTNYYRTPIGLVTTDIANITAGNLKLSGTIAYYGAVPTKQVWETLLSGNRYLKTIPNQNSYSIGINITIQVDNTWYLTKNGTGYTWVQDSTKYVFYESQVGGMIDIGGNAIITKGENLSMVIPPPPSGTYTTLTIAIEASHRNLQLSSLNPSFWGTFTIAQVLDAENNTENELVFESVNSTTNAASVVVEEEIMCGTVNADWASGKIECYSGTAWVSATKFGDKLEGSPTTQFLPQYLAQKTLEYQRQPREVISGGFKLNGYDSTKILIWRSKRWYMLSGSYNPVDAIWNGEWVEISRQTTGFTNQAANPYRLSQMAKLAREVRDLRDVVGNNGQAIGQLFDTAGKLTSQLGEVQAVVEQGVDGFLLQNIEGLNDSPTPPESFTLKAVSDSGTGTYILKWE